METLYNLDKTPPAEPSLIGNIVPDAKRSENFTSLPWRAQPDSLWRHLPDSSVLQKTEIKMVFAKTGSFPQRSSYYHPVELILAILYALIAGIPRLSKTKILQGNGAFQQIIGLKKFPYASSLRRFLKRIDPKVIQGITKVHDQLRLKIFYLPKPRTSLLFDLDSSVLTLYGKLIEGAEVATTLTKGEPVLIIRCSVSNIIPETFGMVC